MKEDMCLLTGDWTNFLKITHLIKVKSHYMIKVTSLSTYSSFILLYRFLCLK